MSRTVVPRRLPSKGAASRVARIRERFQRERPTLQQLVSGGEFAKPVDAEFQWLVRKAVSELKHAREEQGITQSQLADRVDMDVTAVSRIESGRQANLTVQTLG